jgi:hypothetical protein
MKDTALATLTDAGQEVIDWIYTPSGSFGSKYRKIGFSEKMINFFRTIFYKINPDFTVKSFGGYSLMVLTKEA